VAGKPGAIREMRELVPRERGPHRGHGVLVHDGRPGQETGQGRGQESSRARAEKIGDEEEIPRGPGHLAEKRDRLVLGEMMEKERAENDVLLCGKGITEHVERHETGGHPPGNGQLPGSLQRQRTPVTSRHLDRMSFPRRSPRQLQPQSAASAGHVEKTGGSRGPPEATTHHGQETGHRSTRGVDAIEPGERRPMGGLVEIGTVHDLGSLASRAHGRIILTTVAGTLEPIGRRDRSLPQMSTATPEITVSSLRFRYRGGDFLLSLESLVVAPGSAVALIGPSGSGKTTLLDLLAGVLSPDSGKIVLHGSEITTLDHPARRRFRARHLGLVFQDFELLDYLDVLENILLPYRISSALHLHGEVRRRARQLTQEVGLGDKLTRKVNRLSQGERQRVAVCRALLTEPPVILADEPTGHLDPGNRDHVLDILFQDRQRRGSTLLLATHDEAILGRFDRVLDFGRTGDGEEGT